MELQLIRNATIKIQYNGKIILIDPMLSEKNTFPPFLKGLLPNPTVDLNLTPDEILQDVDCVLVTHTHPDHFDDMSKELLPKHIKLFCSIEDQDYEKFQLFKNKEAIDESAVWENIKITRIEGQHGSGLVLPYMGKVSGFVLECPKEPTLYIVGDSIWYENVDSTIKKFRPEIIVTNSGGGIFPGFEKFPVLPDEQQTIALVKAATHSKVIAVHLESIDFCRVTRKSLREFADKHKISHEQLLIPMDGERIQL